MEERRAAFRKKFGRDPGPGDPVFFDPDADTPTAITPERMERDREGRAAGWVNPAKLTELKELLR